MRGSVDLNMVEGQWPLRRSLKMTVVSGDGMEVKVQTVPKSVVDISAATKMTVRPGLAFGRDLTNTTRPCAIAVTVSGDERQSSVYGKA